MLECWREYSLCFEQKRPTLKVTPKGTSLYNQRVKKDAIQLVNKILAKGREEGSTPAQRLKAIVKGHGLGSTI